MESKGGKIGSWLIGHPRTVLGVAALVALTSLLLLSRFRIDPDVASLLPRDDSTLKLTRHLQGDSPPSRVLLIILHSDQPADLDAAIPGLADRLRESPYLSKVIATREEFAGARKEWVRAAPLHFLPMEHLDRLRSRLKGPERRAQLEAAKLRMAEDPLLGKELFLRDPLGIRWIFSEAAGQFNRFPVPLHPGSPHLIFADPPVALIRALGRKDSFDVEFSNALLRDIRSRLGDSGVRAELAGGYVSAAWQAGSMRRDMTFQAVVSALLVLAFLVLFTRSLLAPHLIFIPIALSIVTALAVGGALLGPVTPLVVSAAAIMVAQGVDFTVHFFSRYRTERAGADRDGAIVRAHRLLSRPIAGAALTTMVAFLALLASRFPGFNQFGFLLCLGLGTCLLASLLLFPVLLKADRSVTVGSPWVIRRAAGLQRSRAGIGVAIGLGLLGLAGWAGVLVQGIELDLDLRNSMAPGDPGLKELEALEGRLGVSLTPVFVLVDARTPLEEVGAGVARLRTEGVAAAVDGPHELIPSDQARTKVREFNRLTDGWVQETLDELTGLRVRADPFRSHLQKFHDSFTAPPPRSLEGNPDLKRVYVYSEGDRTYWVVYLFPAVALWDAEGRHAFDDAVHSRLGDAKLFSAFHLPDHYSRVLRGDLTRVALLTALGAVLLTLLAAGHLWDGARALIPALFATGVVLGACVLFGITINLMNMVAVPIILGIGVDGGIHFVCRLRAQDRRDAVRAVQDVGPGVWASCTTTLLGFGSICFSSVPGLSEMGLLVAVGTAAAFVGTVFMLPSLFAGLTR